MNRHLAPAIWDAAFGAAHADAMKHTRPSDPVAYEQATEYATRQALRLADLAAQEAAEVLLGPRVKATPGNPDAKDRARHEKERAIETLMVAEPHLTRMEAERQVEMGGGA